MKEFQISIRSFPEIREFISMATVQPFRVFIGNGMQMLNAKSFIGMVSLDFSRPLKVLCDCDTDQLQRFRQQAGRFLA